MPVPSKRCWYLGATEVKFQKRTWWTPRRRPLLRLRPRPRRRPTPRHSRRGGTVVPPPAATATAAPPPPSGSDKAPTTLPWRRQRQQQTNGGGFLRDCRRQISVFRFVRTAAVGAVEQHHPSMSASLRRCGCWRCATRRGRGGPTGARVGALVGTLVQIGGGAEPGGAGHPQFRRVARSARSEQPRRGA